MKKIYKNEDNIFFKALAIFTIYIIIYRKTKKRSYRDEKTALKMKIISNL